MFKALNTQTGKDLISLDAKRQEDVKALRDLGHTGFLICHGCQQPVLLRAGSKKRPHFAHKTLQNCSYGHASPRLLQARAVLYERLQRDFGASVTIEKTIEGIVLPRPIDCWVERPSGLLAYWIFEGGMKAQKRREFQEAWAMISKKDNADELPKTIKSHINWVFLNPPIESDVEKPIELSPTERDFIKWSVFDQINSAWDNREHGSLHYLNPENETLTTLRSLHLIHAPKRYQGHRKQNSFEKVLIATKTGDFVHPDEYEQWKQLKQEHEKRSEQQREKAELKQIEDNELQERRQEWADWSGRWEAEQESRRQEKITNTNAVTDAIRPNNSPILSVHNQEGICISCGQKTTEWWYYNGKTGECKCNRCLHKNKISPR